VNSSKRYASLRQVYYSLIMAQWFKARYHSQRTDNREQSTDSSLRAPQGRSNLDSTITNLIDSKNLSNLTSKTPWFKDTYFQAYKKSFSQGEYNLKEQVYGTTGQTMRSYVSGGMVLDASSAITQQATTTQRSGFTFLGAGSPIGAVGLNMEAVSLPATPNYKEMFSKKLTGIERERRILSAKVSNALRELKLGDKVTIIIMEARLLTKDGMPKQEKDQVEGRVTKNEPDFSYFGNDDSFPRGRLTIDGISFPYSHITSLNVKSQLFSDRGVLEPGQDSSAGSSKQSASAASPVTNDPRTVKTVTKDSEGVVKVTLGDGTQIQGANAEDFIRSWNNNAQEKTGIEARRLDVSNPSNFVGFFYNGKYIVTLHTGASVEYIHAAIAIALKNATVSSSVVKDIKLDPVFSSYFVGFKAAISKGELIGVDNALKRIFVKRKDAIATSVPNVGRDEVESMVEYLESVVKDEQKAIGARRMASYALLKIPFYYQGDYSGRAKVLSVLKSSQTDVKFWKNRVLNALIGNLGLSFELEKGSRRFISREVGSNYFEEQISAMVGILEVIEYINVKIAELKENLVLCDTVDDLSVSNRIKSTISALNAIRDDSIETFAARSAEQVSSALTVKFNSYFVSLKSAFSQANANLVTRAIGIFLDHARIEMNDAELQKLENYLSGLIKADSRHKSLAEDFLLKLQSDDKYAQYFISQAGAASPVSKEANTLKSGDVIVVNTPGYVYAHDRTSSQNKWLATGTKLKVLGFGEGQLASEPAKWINVKVLWSPTGALLNTKGWTRADLLDYKNDNNTASSALVKGLANLNPGDHINLTVNQELSRGVNNTYIVNGVLTDNSPDFETLIIQTDDKQNYPATIAYDDVLELEVAASSGLGNDKSPGGIDFRALPIVSYASSALKSSIVSSPIAKLDNISLSKEVLAIQKMVEAGITPSEERIKDFVQASSLLETGNLGEARQKAVLWIAEVLRSQEEECCASSAVLKDMLVVLDSGVSEKELRVIFNGKG
ncbi:MAG: hypothetical protein HZC15_00730, partial [Candidatus Omnitrophica bacterium]|nr:hypothetical protein [Candidatus Omnitrophota bacterium]